ncbi:MAG TPA: corrinoid protein [Terriglobales bacterium]|nr:corrinoid protein [Terriglobales bacterium]
MEADFAAMRQSIVDGAPESALALAKQALEQGAHPLEIIDHGFVPGMSEVGEQFARHQMFLPDMLAAAEAMKAAMSVLEPELKRQGEERPSAGIVVLGTTKGDIHEIGKTLVGTLLTANGFTVHDLGVDVPSDQFAASARELNADIVGVSALLTTTMRGQKSVVQALEQAGLRSSIKIIVGGAPVTQRWAEEIGADGYAKDAISAVALVKNLLAHKFASAEVTV